MTDQITAAEAMRRADRIAAGLNPDKRPATRDEITRARLLKMDAPRFTEEQARAEQRLAELEDRPVKNNVTEAEEYYYAQGQRQRQQF